MIVLLLVLIYGKTVPVNTSPNGFTAALRLLGPPEAEYHHLYMEINNDL